MSRKYRNCSEFSHCSCNTEHYSVKECPFNVGKSDLCKYPESERLICAVNITSEARGIITIRLTIDKVTPIETPNPGITLFPAFFMLTKTPYSSYIWSKTPPSAKCSVWALSQPPKSSIVTRFTSRSNTSANSLRISGSEGR